MGSLFDVFKTKKSMADLEEEDEHLEKELSVEEKKALIRELRKRGQDPKDFSDNGKVGGLNFKRIVAWLKAH